MSFWQFHCDFKLECLAQLNKGHERRSSSKVFVDMPPKCSNNKDVDTCQWRINPLSSWPITSDLVCVCVCVCVCVLGGGQKGVFWCLCVCVYDVCLCWGCGGAVSCIGISISNGQRWAVPGHVSKQWKLSHSPPPPSLPPPLFSPLLPLLPTKLLGNSGIISWEEGGEEGREGLLCRTFVIGHLIIFSGPPPTLHTPLHTHIDTQNGMPVWQITQSSCQPAASRPEPACRRQPIVQ